MTSQPLRLYLTPSSISTLTQFILAVTITSYLFFMARKSWRRKEKTLHTLLLASATTGVSCFILLVFLDTSLPSPWQPYVLFLENTVVALVIALLLQFAYHFPFLTVEQKRESWIVLGLSLLYALYEVGIAIWRFTRLAEHVHSRPLIADYFLVASFVWLFVVLLRQTVRTETTPAKKSWISTLWRPKGRIARTMRAFASIFTIPLCISLLELAYAETLISRGTYELGSSLGILLCLFSFTLIYVNYLPEVTTLMVKLVGAALVTILAVLGALGWMVLPRYIDLYPATGLIRDRQTLRFTPNDRDSYDVLDVPFHFQEDIGTRFAWHEVTGNDIEIPFPFPFYDQTWHAFRVWTKGTISFGQDWELFDARYYHDRYPAIYALFLDLSLPLTPAPPGQRSSGIYIHRAQDRVTITWYQMPEAHIRENRHTFQATLYPDGVFEITHNGLSTPKLTLYHTLQTALVGAVAGVPGDPPQHVHFVTDLPHRGNDRGGIVQDDHLDFRRYLHRLLLPLMYFIVISSVFIGVAFPLFFQFNLVRPLNSLLDGVRQINNGHLEITIPVQYNDEIGFLTQSFNSTVAKLGTLVANLEAQVAERTQQLENQTVALAHSIDTALEAQREAERDRKIAESANRAKSIFLANMSHELRTPLNAILGFAGLIASNPRIPDKEIENLDIIRRSGEHLLALINDVLNLSKIEADRITLDPASFDLYRLIDDLENMFRLRANDMDLQLFTLREPDVPQYVRTDQGKLRQVLINLLGNAVKFTEEGGVALRVSRLPNQHVDEPETTLDPLSPAAYLLSPACTLSFEVEDTGPGIAPDELGTLFEAFIQTETGHRSQEGTGLGLAISQRFVRLLGGEITVRSEVGRGTAFTFDIPIELAQASDLASHQPLQRAIGLAPGQPGYRILVADDQWSNRQLLIRLLEPLGFEVREAENGQQAIEVWQAWQPHLIWMDLHMQRMEDYEATMQIKSRAMHETPVTIVALTASSFQEERARVLSTGCDDFLHKPFREADVIEILSKHLGARFVYTELTPASQKQEIYQERQDIKNLRTQIQEQSSEWQANLHRATVEGALNRISILIGQIRRTHPDLANALTELADNFEHNTILVLLRHASELKSQEEENDG